MLRRGGGVEASLQGAEPLQHALAEEGAGVDALRRKQRRLLGKGPQGGDDGAQLPSVRRQGGGVGGRDGRPEAEPFPLAGAAHAAIPMTMGATTILPERMT